MIKKWIGLCLVFLLILPPVYSKALSEESSDTLTWNALMNLVSPEHAYQYIETIASPEFEGRQSGTSGADKTANYIGQLFQGFGLNGIPDAPENTYNQTFEIPTYTVLEGTSLRLVTQDQDKNYLYRSDFAPLGLSSSGDASGAAVFVGYGIQSEALKWDDYATARVSGKIAIMFRRSPDFMEFPEESYLFKTKIELAKKQGAIGVLMMDKPVEENMYVIDSKSVSAQTGSNLLPTMFISQDTANEMLLSAGTDLQSLYEKIEDKQRPVSLDLKAGIEMRVNSTLTMEPTSNVIGIIPAENPDTTEHIIICAHYDHLGKDLVSQTYFPGANDNASGTGVLIELARILSSFYFHPKINVVFIAFTGEEEGLLGSRQYVEHPIFPLKKALAVLNMDMVGTGTGRLYSGTDASVYPTLAENITTASEKTGVKTIIYPNLLGGGSDHLQFVVNKVPSVFFLRSNPTGIGGYHDEKDTIKTISQKNLEEQIKLVLGTVWLFTEPSYFIVNLSDGILQKTPIYHPMAVLKGVGSEGIDGSINDVFFQIDQSGILNHLVILQSGEHVIQLKVHDRNNLVFEKFIHYSSVAQSELASDFNFDYQVNLTDMLWFAKQWESTGKKSIERDLADINRDSFVNGDDFALFNQSFGYTINP